MVATTLFLTLVSLGSGPVHRDRARIVLSLPNRAVAHLAVPTGVAMPTQRDVSLAVSDLFKNPVRTETIPAVAEKRIPDRRARLAAGITDPTYRPSCSL